MRARIAYAARAFALLFAAGALAWLSTRHAAELDVSAGRRHTLSPASVEVLGALRGPIEAVAYVPERHPARAQIEALFAKYRRHRPDLTLRFVDPAEAADEARADRVQDGEILLSAGGRTERLQQYAEQPLTNALARLARADEQWLAFVTGHGERSPLREANFDVSGWASVLGARGLAARELNLADTRAIPDNTALLVIASPQLPYLDGELALIERYLARGGNLLWLTEPDAPRGFGRLERAAGVERLPATVVDPVSAALGIDDPAVAVVSRYADHPALSGFAAASVLPHAALVHERPAAGWRAQRLFESNGQAWGERGPLEGNVGYDDGADYPGPLPLAIALERPRPGGEAGATQRIVVVGDGDFLSNTFIGNAGNQDLGTRLVEWLTASEALIAVATRTAPDTTLELSRWQQAVIAIGFLIALPAAFALNGGFIWWRRNRA